MTHQQDITSVWGVVQDGKVVLPTSVSLENGTQVLVTAFPNEEAKFWNGVSASSLDAVWNNSQDDVYEQLLEK